MLRGWNEIAVCGKTRGQEDPFSGKRQHPAAQWLWQRTKKKTRKRIFFFFSNGKIHFAVLCVAIFSSSFRLQFFISFWQLSLLSFPLGTRSVCVDTKLNCNWAHKAVRKWKTSRSQMTHNFRESTTKLRKFWLIFVSFGRCDFSCLCDNYDADKDNFNDRKWLKMEMEFQLISLPRRFESRSKRPTTNRDKKNVVDENGMRNQNESKRCHLKVWARIALIESNRIGNDVTKKAKPNVVELQNERKRETFLATFVMFAHFQSPFVYWFCLRLSLVFACNRNSNVNNLSHMNLTMAKRVRSCLRRSQANRCRTAVVVGPRRSSTIRIHNWHLHEPSNTTFVIGDAVTVVRTLPFFAMAARESNQQCQSL